MASYKDASPKATLRLLQENLPRISQNISLSINTEISSLSITSQGGVYMDIILCILDGKITK